MARGYTKSSQALAAAKTCVDASESKTCSKRRLLGLFRCPIPGCSHSFDKRHQYKCVNSRGHPLLKTNIYSVAIRNGTRGRTYASNVRARGLPRSQICLAMRRSTNSASNVFTVLGLSVLSKVHREETTFSSTCAYLTPKTHWTL